MEFNFEAIVIYILCVRLAAALPVPSTAGTGPLDVQAAADTPILPVVILNDSKTRATDAEAATSSLRHCMFVYGTLKTGEPNYYVMRDGIGNGSAQFVGAASTVERYPLVIGSRYNIPFILYRPRAGDRIDGELYMVDDRFRAVLDEFEDHPAVFQRYPIRVERATAAVAARNGQDRSEVRLCYVYLLFDYATHMLDLKTYKTYANKGLPSSQRYVVDEDIGSDAHALTEIKEAFATPTAVAPAA